MGDRIAGQSCDDTQAQAAGPLAYNHPRVLDPSAHCACPGLDPTRMKRELIWVLSAKLAALGLLWLLFFSGPHRLEVDPAQAARHLGMAPVPAPAAPETPAAASDPRSRPQERTGD